MKLTKEDYMRLPKERLAELLVEADNKEHTIQPLTTSPFITPSPSIVPFDDLRNPPFTITGNENSIGEAEVDKSKSYTIS